MKRLLFMMLTAPLALLGFAQAEQPEPPARGTVTFAAMERPALQAPASPKSISAAEPFRAGTVPSAPVGAMPVRKAPGRAWQQADIVGDRQLMANNHSTHVCYGGDASVSAVGADSVAIARFCFGDVTIRAHVDYATGAVTIPTQFIDSVQGMPVYLCRMDFRTSTYDKTASLRGHLYKGSIVIDDGFGFFVTEGAQAGAYLTVGLFDYAAVAQPNATITARRITFKNNTQTVANRQVTDQVSNGFAYPVSPTRVRLMRLPVVTSFSDIDLTLTPDGRVNIDPQAISQLSLYGDFFIYNMTESNDGTNVKFSINVLNPVEATYTTGDKKLTWGSWAVARPNALLGSYEGASVTFTEAIEFPQAPTLNLEGEGTQSSPWLIKTADDLAALRYDIVNNATYRGALTSDGNDHQYYPVYAGKYFRLANDIDFGTDAPGVDPIGDTQHWFAGSFDGAGHTLTNFFIDNYAYDYAGLFGHIARGGELKNIKMHRAVVNTIGYTAGTLVGYSYAPLTDITVTDSRVVAAMGYNAGTVAGYCSEPMTRVNVSGTYVQALGYTGGIAGRSYSNITDCHAQGRVIATGKQVFSGGLVGHGSKQTTASPAPVIARCSYTGVVQATGDEIGVGGLFGALSYSKLQSSFANAVVSNASSMSAYVGGLVGTTFQSEIVDCYATGYVRNPETTMCGGLVGHNTKGLNNEVPTVIRSSYSSAMVLTKSASDTRGITGDTENFTITDCWFDNQVGVLPGAKWGLNTSALTSGALPQGFSADSWNAAAGSYPTLKGNDTTAAARVSSAAVVLGAGQTINDIQTDFSYSPVKLTWQALKADGLDSKGGYAFTFDGGTGRLNYEQYTDTVYAIEGRASKYWFLNIAPAPFDGKGTAEEPWLLKTRQDVRKFSDMSNNARMTFAGRYVVLNNDIDCQGDTIVPVCKDKAAKLVFEGNFDGRGHTLDNFRILGVAFFTEDNVTGTAVPGQVNPKDEGSYYYSGLFANVGKSGVVRNLTVGPKADIQSFQYGGAIAGGSEGLIENCRNYARVRTYFSCSGGIVGYLKAGGIVRGCYNDGFIAVNAYNAGGIAGQAQQGRIEKCENTGEIAAYWFNPYQKEGSQYCAGGIAGNCDRTVLENVVNSGLIRSYKQVGGIAGKMAGTAAIRASATAAVNYGLVYASAERSSQGSIAGTSTNADYAACLADKQIQKVGTVSGGLLEGTQMLPTLSLASAQGYPQQLLPDSVWSLASGKYPTMKYAAGQQPLQSRLNSTAVIRFPANDFAQSMVADAPLSAGVDWKVVNNFVFSIADNTLKVLPPMSGCFTDTVVASLEGATRRIPVAALNCVLTEGEGTMAKPFLIRETSEWMAVARFMKQWDFDYQGYYFKLMSNLDFRDTEFLPLGADGVMFNGSFDGNDKSISNVSYEGVASDRTQVGRGLFGTLGYDGFVSGLTLKSGSISGYQNVGGIAGICYGNVLDCHNSATVTTLGTTGAGGMAGYAYPGAQFLMCSNSGAVIAKTNYAGGIVGGTPAAADVSIDECSNSGTVAGASKIGGIAGSASAAISKCANTGEVRTSTTTGTYAAGIVAEALVPSSVENCSNSGTVWANQYMAGIVSSTVAHTAARPFRLASCANTADLAVGAKGYAGGVGSAIKAGSVVTDCLNTGKLSGPASGQIRIGGVLSEIATSAGAPSSVSNCRNYGSVEAWSNSGGVIAAASGDSLKIVDCRNTASVKGNATSGTNVGGILGNGPAEFIDCWNSGDIVGAGNQVGGINGTNTAKSLRMTRCVNIGDVTAGTTSAGGMIGLGRATMTDCYNSGDITGTSAVGGLFGQPGAAASPVYTIVVDRCYNTGKITATSNWGNIMGQNSSCKYLSIGDKVFANTDTTALSDYDNALRVTGLRTGELMQRNISDAFALNAYTFPTLKAQVANDTLNIAACAVVPSSGETLQSVRTHVYLSQVPGAEWTSSTAALIVKGDYASNRSQGDNTPAQLTLKLGGLQRVFDLNLMKYSGVDGLDTDARPVLRVEYYRTDGARTTADDTAPVLIRRTVYTDGTSSVAKIANRNRR